MHRTGCPWFLCISQIESLFDHRRSCKPCTQGSLTNLVHVGAFTFDPPQVIQVLHVRSTFSEHGPSWVVPFSHALHASQMVSAFGVPSVFWNLAEPSQVA